MTSLAHILDRVCQDLRGEQVRFALVGGLAVSARARPRFTQDVDLAVAIESDSDAERLVRSLGARGYRIAEVLESARTGCLSTVRFHPPAASARTSPTPAGVDLLFTTSGIETEIVERAEPVEVEGILVPVASRGHLIALKVLAASADRPRDREDLLELLRLATEQDIQLARGALELITVRGANRDKDLIRELHDALDSLGPS